MGAPGGDGAKAAATETRGDGGAKAAPAVVAFVAGATGFVGRAVVAALVARGATTIAHVRPDSKELEEWRRRFGDEGARVDTTAWDEAALTETFRREGVTHVFCLIGTTRGRAKKDGVKGDIYEAIDVGLTRKLASAASACGLRPRFVYLSSVGASARSSSAYLRARAKAEALAQGAAVPWVIARPSMIVGPGRDDSRPMERAAGAAADGVLAVIGLFGAKKLRASYRSTTPAILANALVTAGLDGPADRILAGDDLR